MAGNDPLSATPHHLGRYDLMELLGRGGMAEVYKARLPGALGINKLVAVKRILPEAARNPEFVQMFIKEARVSARLMHPNLVQIFEFSHDGEELFLAMEWVEGADLRKVLNANKILGKSLPLEMVICIANGVLRGLDYAHRLCDEEGRSLNVVHRDLSPANVLLGYEGAVKVADFGVAHAEGEKTDVTRVKGKLQYMAPEQLLTGEIDARVDVFAAGCLIYEMLSGRTVYMATNTAELLQQVVRGAVVPIQQVVPDCPPELAAVIHRALAARREERFSSCDELASALIRLVQAGRLPLAPESELGLYVQVIVPNRQFRPELVHTPSLDLARHTLMGSGPSTNPSLKPPPKPTLEAPSITDPGFREIVSSTPARTSPAPQPPRSNPSVSVPPAPPAPTPAPPFTPSSSRGAPAASVPPPKPPSSTQTRVVVKPTIDIDEMIRSYLDPEEDPAHRPNPKGLPSSSQKKLGTKG